MNDLEIEEESQRRYNPTILHYEKRIENCENAIGYLEEAKMSLDNALDEVSVLLNIRDNGIKIIKTFIQIEIDNLKEEKEGLVNELENN